MNSSNRWYLIQIKQMQAKLKTQCAIESATDKAERDKLKRKLEVISHNINVTNGIVSMLHGDIDNGDRIKAAMSKHLQTTTPNK